MVVQESDDELTEDDPAPDFELPGVNGETYTLESFADDEGLLVVFTCNHCPYAKAKFDVLNGLADDYDEVSVVGINPNDSEEYPEDSFEKMGEYAEEGRVDYDAYLRDESQEVARAYGAQCTPDPFLFRNDGGTFRLAYHGRLDDAHGPDEEPTEPGGEIREAIDQVLAGEEVTVEWNPSRGCSIKWRDD